MRLMSMFVKSYSLTFQNSSSVKKTAVLLDVPEKLWVSVPMTIPTEISTNENLRDCHGMSVITTETPSHAV